MENKDLDLTTLLCMILFTIGSLCICLDMVFGDSLSRSQQICETGKYQWNNYDGLDRLFNCLSPYVIPLSAMGLSVTLTSFFKSIIPVVFCIILSVLFYFLPFFWVLGFLVALIIVFCLFFFR